MTFALQYVGFSLIFLTVAIWYSIFFANRLSAPIAKLIYASKKISCEPIFCAYIGDDIRDITAANAANMFSIAAAYGFIDDISKIKEWGSDYIINSPLDLEILIN